MMMDELGLDVDKIRRSIDRADSVQARYHAHQLLDELIAARRLIHDKLTDPLAPVNPTILWGAAVEALRRLAVHPAAFGRERTDAAALLRAAGWLAAIGPNTDKLPCEECLKPTDRVCSRCDRPFCTTHVTLNLRTGVHVGGLRCV